MDQESITRGILSGIIDRYIDEIAADPNRSIRKLLDMAERTSDGPTQKICYQMMQRMAENRNSPYYKMIHHLVTHASPEAIKKTGINLGRNAWTFGSGKVRLLSESSRTAIPWAVLIDRTGLPGRIPFEEIRDLVRRGRQQEIYAWLLMVSGPLDEWAETAELIRGHDDSVFGLCVSPDALTEEILSEAAELSNLMLFLDTDRPGWQERARELEGKGCIFCAFHAVSTAAQAREITSGEWLESLAPAHPLIAFALTADDCPVESAVAVSHYMWETRADQVYPVLPSSLISDFMVISRLVSHQEVLFRVEPDGSVSEGNGLRFVPGRQRCGDLFKSD